MGLGIFILLIFVLFIIAAAYIHFNKDNIIATIKEKINNSINGTLTIDNVDVSILSTFPNASVNLYEVDLLDSLYQKPLVQAKEIAFRINVFQLFSSNPDIAKLVINNASLNIFTDSSGYSNSSAFAKKDPSKSSSQQGSTIRKIELKNAEVSIADAPRNKLYAFTLKSVMATVDKKDSLLYIKMDEECFVKGLGFNLRKGSYLQNQVVEAKNWNLILNPVTQDLTFGKTDISINRHPYSLEGGFHFKDSSWFQLHVVTKDVGYMQAGEILTERIRQKLSLMGLTKPLNILEADVSGPLAKRSDPHILAKWITSDNDITTPIVNFNNCSFSGTFDNNVTDTLETGDENTAVIINNLKAKWGNIPLTADSLRVWDLSNPIMQFNFHSNCNFEQLDEQLALKSIKLTNGNAHLSLQYNGPLIPDPSLLSKLTADIKIENGTLLYEPRNISFTNCNGSVSISENNISVDRLTCDVKQNHFEINITGVDVNKLAQQDSGKTYIACNVFTPSLNLGDFKAAFTTKKNKSSRKGTSKLAATALKIDDMLEKGDMQLNLKSPNVQLEKFTAGNVQAQLLFQQDDWEIQNASLQHAGGSLTVSGKIHQVNPDYHEATAKVNLQNVDVRKVFYAFNNFGQTGISYTNLRGKMNTTASIKAGLNSKGHLMDNSMYGTVDFSVKNGALLNYEPLQEIQKSFLKNRDLSNVTFAELKDKLTIKGSQIHISRMEVASSAFTMYVEGVYGFKEGTDISIQIPLSNLKDPDKNPGIQPKGANAKVGPSIFLRAKNGVSGKVKIGVDVFRMLRKKKKTDTKKEE
ncbi:MAG: AsmA family protein [Panacibacter sp.]